MIGEFFLISEKINRKIADVFTNNEDVVLDLGCGNKPGYHKHIKGKIICFDRFKNKIMHVVGDADKLPFRANSFDKIVSINSLYYFRNPFNVMKDLHKSLKKNGRVVLVLPFFYPIHDAPADRYRFTEYGLRALLEEHFKIDKIEPIGGIFNMPAVILHSLIKGLPLLFPKPIRSFVKIAAYLFYPFYIIAQIFSLLDMFDRTRRFPTYYFLVAGKK